MAGSARMPAPSLGSAPLAPPSTSKALAQGRRLWLYGVGALTVGAFAVASLLTLLALVTLLIRKIVEARLEMRMGRH